MAKKGTRTIFPCSSPPHSSQPTQNYNFLSPTMHQNIEKASSVIKKWDTEEESANYCRIDFLFAGDRIDAKEFLESVKDLQSVMQFILNKDSNSDKLIQVQNLLKISMTRLQKEFHRILSSNRTFSHAETFPKNAILDLKSIAEVMILSGYGKECVSIYKTVHKSILEESLYGLGVERLNLSQMQKMDWEKMENKIKLWVNAVKPSITSLFQGEKTLCKHVFAPSSEILESCFAGIISDGAKILFEFLENIAKLKNLTPEKIFHFLDLYEAFSELMPEIESVFSYKSLSLIRSLAINSLARLGKAIKYILADFEAAIQKEASKTSVPGGGVHPLTRYVMNYVITLSDYSGTLTGLFSDYVSPVRSPMPEFYFSSNVSGNDPASVVTEKFAWIILLLLCKLDVKAELYNDVALSYLFLANNLNYVVLKVRDSSLKVVLGDEWLVNNENKVRQYAGSYERIGWSKVVSSLIDPTAETPRETLRECIGKFSMAFEEAYRKQSSWVLPEQKLRDETKVSIAKKIGPKYRVVYEMYWSKMKGKVGVECSVRYAPDNLGNYISDLFYGTGNLFSTSSF